MSVFAAPGVPIPACDIDEIQLDDFATFFNDIIKDLPTKGQHQQQQQMSMQQPPEQPLLDNPHLHHQLLQQQQQGDIAATSPGAVVKQEQETGFLNTWNEFRSMSLEQQATDEYNRCSPEMKRLNESQLVKTELHCHIKLKMMKEGKDFPSMEADDQTTQRDFPISDETKQLQRVRREKNREAAKKCRQKKKATERDQEQKLREKEHEVRMLQQQLNESRQEYSNLLVHFPNLPCFLAYLKVNRHLVRSASLKPVLQNFVQTHGARLAGSQHQSGVESSFTGGGCTCTAAPAAAVAVAAQPMQFFEFDADAEL